MQSFFKLKENNTKVSTEIVAGLTTFFAMSYILFVNPGMLGLTGMPTQAVFLATIFASVAGTLVMGLFANVPYAQAPGMGLNAFFTYTVCFQLGFTWQEALAMVFICGVINVIITVSKIRKMLIKAIPESLQNAIGGGIGIFIAYIGVKNAGLLSFTSDPGKNIVLGNGTVIADSSIIPSLVNLNNVTIIYSLLCILIMVVLVLLKVKGAVFISIIVSALLGNIISVAVPGSNIVSASVLDVHFTKDLGGAFAQLGQTFGAAFGAKGMGSLFSTAGRIPLVLMTIFAFSLSDTFDTIGTFIGTGRHTGIFTAEDQLALENSTGFKSKMDKALFADSVATSVGALFGTSNTTTYIESAAGIGAGGRTGLTSVVTAIMFMLSIVFAPFLGFVPMQATAPALIIVGIMMLASFAEIDWKNLDVAVPAFFAGIFMALCYSISYGIAFGFIFYCIVKLLRKQAKQVHPILWACTALFVLNFIMLALISVQ